ncbi:hypothetical protein [Burkholderia sp. THE68]|uniref:hypothetical protein n=1 Tax=Burkholderia sp. THE68 TaxID=758782 RepID=UPI00138983EB|nr:hypothetical protein [Burkholderia sp. THE68]
MFIDYVEPVMADFETIHAEYMKNFHRYSDMLSDRSVPFNEEHPVFEEIRRNTIAAQHLKTRVRMLGEMPDVDERLTSFVFSIWHYFWLSSAFVSVPAREGTPATVPVRGSQADSPRNVLLRMKRTRSAGYVLSLSLHEISGRNTSLNTVLRAQSSEDLHGRAQAAVWSTAKILQDKYAAVYFEFTKLKQRLLKPI